MSNRPRVKGLLSVVLVLVILLLSGCRKEKAEETKTIVPDDPSISFEFSRPTFTTGEAVCVRIDVVNNTMNDIAIKDFPAKKMQLIGPDGSPVMHIQRADYPRPPKMFLQKGEASSSELNLTGFFENLGPGMLSPGKYIIETTFTFYRGEDIKFRQHLRKLTASRQFEVVAPTGDDKAAFDEYVAALGGTDALGGFVGQKKILLSETIRAKLDSIADKYSRTAIGSRILVNDLGIWYRNVPLDRYARFFDETKPECPCCLHRHVIDRMIKRYIRTSEREQILDIAESALERYPAGTPVGDYLRGAFAFRIEGGKLIR